jgi:hypothetical protein
MLCFDHQSQESTDVRWIKLMHFSCIGKIQYPREMKDKIDEIRLYPDNGDIKKFVHSYERAR